MIERDFCEVLACPHCKGPLEEDVKGSAVRCRTCRLLFPVRDGFPILLVDEAVPESPLQPPPRRRSLPPIP